MSLQVAVLADLASELQELYRKPVIEHVAYPVYPTESEWLGEAIYLSRRIRELPPEALQELLRMLANGSATAPEDKAGAIYLLAALMNKAYPAAESIAARRYVALTLAAIPAG